MRRSSRQAASALQEDAGRGKAGDGASCSLSFRHPSQAPEEPRGGDCPPAHRRTSDFLPGLLKHPEKRLPPAMPLPRHWGPKGPSPVTS